MAAVSQPPSPPPSPPPSSQAPPLPVHHNSHNNSIVDPLCDDNNHDGHSDNQDPTTQVDGSSETRSPSPSSPVPQPRSTSLHHHHHSSASLSSIRLVPAPTQRSHPDAVPTKGKPSSTWTNSRRPASQKPSGIRAIAAAAFDKTIANISEPGLGRRSSSTTLRRLSLVPEPSVSPASEQDKERSRSRNSTRLPGPYPLSRRSSLVSPKDPISTPYLETDPSRPPPIIISPENKMHQTSSRLLRMTDDERPFTKDFKDLYSTLIVSLLPLSSHRVRLTRVEHTFLSEDAINNLGSLKFSQSNRMPDPKDPSRIVTTTTTTTFSMAKDMARSICQRFLDARFIESADGKLQQTYTMKGSVWQLTSKGVAVLDRFCSRNGIQQRQIGDLIATGVSQLCILERDPTSDKLVMDRGTMEVVFRRMIGANGLNIKSSTSSADSESLSDYRDGLTGVKMASERKIAGKTFKDTFTGKACSDWLMDCCTTVDRRETLEMASLFVEYDLMESVQQDRGYMATSPSGALFQPTKNAIYQMTTRGREVINGSGGRGRTSESDGIPATTTRPGVARDSNTQRLDKILNDAALRLLFRENLRETHCEENLSFYLDVDEFVRSCKAAIRVAQKNPNATSMDGIKEIMAQAYGIYNAFLAPGSPCELNIDHQLRNNLATRMTKAVGQDVAMIDTLHEVTALFEDAQNAVFKLMASDSVPKFLRNAKYESTLKNYDFDAVVLGNGRVPERSQSRSNRK
ncbi:regulator of G protein signaling domain-containing protein [Microdochium trichocladiopsis]|uniref:Regulator of G protein signaling domain-containing protein n=1 Tax=Microdochium trichocladiopsis TaxID=1682393 RepID=A0A9P8Y9P5_9PEZI|nr:regulator of G protein signaling domain-containing protein [Microdochium trichocladiopsis]KAH7031260.1 regulator of G protein signaling domain-containing protein [Microdochium trichocladiopsis]